MNRENKRKQYEKGYYKTHPCNETYCTSTFSNRQDRRNDKNDGW